MLTNTITHDSKIGATRRATTSLVPFTMMFIRVSAWDSKRVRLSVGLLPVDGHSGISYISKLLLVEPTKTPQLWPCIRSLFALLSHEMNLQRCKNIWETIPNTWQCSAQVAVLRESLSGYLGWAWISEPDVSQYLSTIGSEISSMFGFTSQQNFELQKTKILSALTTLRVTEH